MAEAGDIEFVDKARSTPSNSGRQGGGVTSSERHDSGGGIRKSGDR